ncbi:MAG: glycoside hydrolase family 20 zincin-like fold domain-containing protein, partial [bacterium]
MILPATPPESDRRAARVLQHYLRAITNRQVTVAEGVVQADKPLIFIGKQAATRLFGLQAPPELTPDAYFLQGKENVFGIVGGGENGAEYGVYTLLEMLGCRKFSPRDSILPYLPDLTLPELPPTLEKPAFAY